MESFQETSERVIITIAFCREEIAPEKFSNFPLP